MSIQAHTYQRHILQSTEQLDRWSNDIPCLFNNKASIPLAASMVLMLHRKYGKLHGVKAFFFFLPFLFYHSFLPCWAQENSEILLVPVFYQEGEKRDPLLPGFPNFSDGLYKAQRSNQYLSPSNSICPFFWLHPRFRKPASNFLE